MKKQTAVEWLFKKLLETPKDKFTWYTILNKAMEMEKEQQRLIYEGLLQNVGTSIKQSDLPTFEQYYNETYEN